MPRTPATILSAAACLLLALPVLAAGQPPAQGTASAEFIFEAVYEGHANVFRFEQGVDAQGNPGRLVRLSGDIEGINFEPGECMPGVDTSNPGFLTSCVNFGTGPGQFVRARPGQTAFTTCECTVGGVGGEDSSFVLKISYPKATPPQYPFGFTKFTFLDGTGELEGLRGQGTLDFAASPQVTFTYHFAGR
jgi:hypothetical protein